MDTNLKYTTMKKIILILIATISLIALPFLSHSQVTLTLPQIQAAWNTTSVPKGYWANNTFYTLYNITSGYVPYTGATSNVNLGTYKILIGDGNVSAPSLSFSSQTNSGFWKNTTYNAITWGSGGTYGGVFDNGGLYLKSTGNLAWQDSDAESAGANTAIRKSALRTINIGANGGASANYLRVQGNATNYIELTNDGTNSIVNTQSGAILLNANVGIGSATPANKLDVSANTLNMTTARILHSGNAGNAGTALKVSNGYAAAGGSYEIFGVYGNNFGTGYLSVNDAGNTAITNSLFVTTNVGINTQTPASKLEIYDNTGAQLALFRMRKAGVATGFTGIVPTDVVGFHGYWNGTTGGYFQGGLSTDGTTPAFLFIGYNGATGSVTGGCLEFRGAKRSGTGTAALSTTDVLSTITNNGTIVSTTLGNGSIKLAGTGSPTAYIHLSAGTATASTAPLKFTSGTNLTTAETGAMEYNGTNLFFTRTGTTRENVLTTASVNSVSPTSPNRTITVVIDGVTYYIAAKTTND